MGAAKRVAVRWGRFLFSLAFASVVASQASAQSTPPKEAAGPVPAAKARQFSVANKPWTGDFDKILKRRMMRVYAPYSRTIYFIDKGQERGLGAELVRDFERWVNVRYARQLGKRPLTIYIVAATRDKLLTDLPDGLADMAIGNFTVTEERLKLVDFVAPDEKLANTELLVTGPSSPAIATLDDLSGKTLHVRKSSSYYESVMALNGRFAEEGRAAVNVVLVPDALEDEDMMEMLNAGLLQAMVVDDFKAKLWAQVLPRIEVREDIRLREPTREGWAIRKGSPQLAAVLNEFYSESLKKTGIIESRMKRYMRTIKQLNNPAGADYQRFQQTIEFFEKYGQRYGFDPLMLAAQGYQESRLDQDARSPVGAIGVMQLMPATGKELRVGDIHEVEANIHGGAKYMDHLLTRYFKDANFSEQNRTLFAFASYNCGPGNISKMRRLAKKRGLDPDKWFNNVEVVTAEKIGAETTTYVRNIFKYYVSYKLTEAAQARAEELKRQVVPAPQ